MDWVIISPTDEEDCHPLTVFEKVDSAVYRVLNIHADYAQQYLTVVKRFKQDANPSTVLEYLSKHPANILAFGHGNTKAMGLNECKIWLDVNHIPEWVKGKNVVLVSCLTGVELGKKLAEKGANYYGLDNVGMLVAAKDAEFCRFFYADFIGLLEAAISLANGYSEEEAAKRAKIRWKNEIEYWLNFYSEEEIKLTSKTVRCNSQLAQLLTTCMVHNMHSFVWFPPGGAETVNWGAVVGALALLSFIAVAFKAMEEKRKRVMV